MIESERNQIIDLIKKEVIPAIGCTEPIAVSLCTARAAEVLGRRPERISVLLSANMLKNAMGVGIPGTDGMIGLPIAVALGALFGKSEYGLEGQNIQHQPWTPSPLLLFRKSIINQYIL